MSETERQPIAGDIVDLALGVTAIHNGDLVPMELKLLIAEMMDTEMFKKAVYSIVFEEDSVVDRKTGMPVHATFIPILKSFVVNLRRHISDSLDAVKAEGNKIRFDAILWMNLILTIVHELKHARDLEVECKGDPEQYCDFDDSGAQEWAVNALYELASTGLDMEMPDLIGDDFFGPFMTDFLDDITKSDDPWCKVQRKLFDDNILMVGGIKTIRDYFRATDTKEDREWVVNVDKDEPIQEESKVKAEMSGVLSAIDELKIEPTAKLNSAAEQNTSPANVVVGSQKPVVEEEPRMPAESVMEMEELQPASTVSEIAPTQVETSPTVDPPKASAEARQKTMTTLYHRLYCALFNKTGFNPGKDNDQGFLNPMGILDPIFIGDIPGIEELLISYDSVDINGQYQRHLPAFNKAEDGREKLEDGWIRGTVTKDGSMPAYIIYINVGGFLQKRSIRTQNCNKRRDGQLTKWAQEAREGIATALIYRDLTPVQKEAGENSIIITIRTMPGQDTVMTFNPFDPERRSEMVFEKEGMPTGIQARYAR